MAHRIERQHFVPHREFQREAVILDPAPRPLNPQMGEVTYGNKPTDGGHLIVEKEALKVACNSIESVNADVKGEGHESIASKGRRKVRGFTAAAVIFAIQLTQYNLRTIATFIKKRAIAEELDKPEWPPTQPIRGRDAGAVNLYTKTLPRDPLLVRWAEGELFSPLRT